MPMPWLPSGGVTDHCVCLFHRTGLRALLWEIIYLFLPIEQDLRNSLTIRLAGSPESASREPKTKK